MKWSDLRHVFDIKEDCATKRCTPEEIVAKLRQVDVLVSQGQNRVDAIRQIGVSEVTYYQWRGVRWAEDRAGEAPEGTTRELIVFLCHLTRTGSRISSPPGSLEFLPRRICPTGSADMLAAALVRL